MGDTLAALDIGTNSFHLVIARFSGQGHQFEIIERQKEMVRLGSGRADTADLRALEDDAIDRGIAALHRMRRLADAHDAPLHAVATSAVREAENAEVFLRRARDEAGVEVDVIAGTEEARLIHLGVLQALPVYDKRLVLVDIGGGSTEILVGERGEALSSYSLKLGAIRMTRRFFATERLQGGAVDSCRRHCQATLVPLRREVRKLGFEVAVASSGTAGAVGALVQAARAGEAAEPRTWNGFEMTRAEVEAAVAALAGCATVDERRVLPGMDPKRADIILGGAVILEQVMGQLGMDRVVLSDSALREGVLIDARDRELGGILHHLGDLRRRNVAHLAQSLDDDPDHAAQAARLVLALFDGTQEHHGLDENARELIEAAAWLANVGRAVSHDKHHKHSYYVIRNTDQLTGFTDHEIELIAVMARYHRKSAPRGSHPEWAGLREQDQRLVRVGASLLRVAYALDRSRSAAVETVAITGGSNDEIILTVRGRPGVDLALEAYAVGEHKGMLEETLDRSVVVEIDGLRAAELLGG